MELITQIITNAKDQYGPMVVVGISALSIMVFGIFKLIKLAIIAGLVLLVTVGIIGLKITGVI